ncbi:MAG: serpin family protein [Ruminococcus sp.]|nr:serpin family protein [Ruminococcus sp.]
MLKRSISAVIAITMVMGMCSCSETSPGTFPQQPEPSSFTGDVPQPEPPEATIGSGAVQLTANYSFDPVQSSGTNDEDFISGINKFSSGLFRTAVSEDLAKGKNTLISPESAAFALGMAASGAGGNTLAQMQNVICGGIPIDKFNKNMNLLISNAHNNNTQSSKLNIANSVWVKNDDRLAVKDQFARDCKQMYNAELFTAPFDDSTVNSLNSWVSTKTDNMIPTLINHFTGKEIMCLVNCVAFDSKWQKEYTEDMISGKGSFTNASGEKVECTMLCSTEGQYVENERAKGFVKEYEGGKYAFMAVLPNEDISIADYVSTMSDDELTSLYDNRLISCDVDTRMPQFRFDHSSNLEETLQKMGIKDAFTDDADFKNIFQGKNAAINRVIHKTHIEVDAKGTKAAAATAVTMRENAVEAKKESKQVYLDTPFVFAIIDKQTGIPLFMGTLCDPGAN